MSHGGGMPLFVDDLAVDEMILTTETDRIDTRIKLIHKEHDFVSTEDFLTIIRVETPHVVILHSLKYISKEFVEQMKTQLKSQLVLIVHDYYPICERNNLLNNRKAICSGPYSKNCLYCYFDKYPFIPISRPIRDIIKPAISLFSPSLRWYEKKLSYTQELMKSIDLIVFPSEKSKNILMRFFDDGIKTAVIKHFQKKIMCKLEIRDHPSFGFIGHDGLNKGLELLIRSIKLIDDKNLKLELFGDINMKIKDERVNINGTYENRAITMIMKQFDILVFPSIWPETSGRVLTEAAYCGKVIIASNITPAEEVLHGYKGLYIFENGSDSSLRSTMEKVTADWGKLKYPFESPVFPTVEEYRNKIVEQLEF